ncbi:hypothetical protein [Pseudomonas aeruginosa]|nr:hypothetical protein [Pseudomonas aeruginosa]ERV92896.1 hypothetical protein Q039_02552 [Pseudomonas aeruginosa BWHPSA026]
MKQTFEYHVENIDIPYKTLTKGVAMFKHKEVNRPGFPGGSNS